MSEIHREECEGEVRRWMSSCVQAMGSTTIRWAKLSTGRNWVMGGRDREEGVIDSVVDRLASSGRLL